MSLIAEAAAEYHAQGIPCPWDCGRCQTAAETHPHTAACGHTATCYDEECEAPDTLTEACFTCTTTARREAEAVTYGDPTEFGF